METQNCAPRIVDEGGWVFGIVNSTPFTDEGLNYYLYTGIDRFLVFPNPPFSKVQGVINGAFAICHPDKAIVPVSLQSTPLSEPKDQVGLAVQVIFFTKKQ